MKRKLALLLAAVMTLSMLPMNVFAASSNSVRYQPASLGEDELMTETNTANPGTAAIWDVDSIHGTGSELRLKFDKGETAEGKTFGVILSNSEWFFKATSDAGVTVTAGDVITSLGGLNIGVNITSFVNASEDDGTGNYTTYNVNNGVWLKNEGSGVQGVYLRYALDGTSKSAFDYAMVVGSNGTEASVTMLSAGALNVGGDVTINIPLVILTDNDTDPVTVRVEDQGAGASSGTYTISAAVTGATTATIGGVEKGRENVKLKTITIRETRAGTIEPGAFYIDAPSGYEFDVPDSGTSTLVTTSSLNLSTGAIEVTKYSVNNMRRLVVTIPSAGFGGTKGSSRLASIYIDNIVLVPLKDTTWGEITGLKITNKDAGVSSYTFGVVGERVDYGVSLTAASSKDEVPTLFTGVYPDDGDVYADNADSVKVLRIQLKEQQADSWWTTRETKLTFPEGVLIRGVQVADTDNLNSAIDKTSFASPGATNSTMLSVNKDADTITLKDIKKGQINKKSMIQLDIWVSISNSMDGKDIELSVEGGGMSGDTLPEPLVVAKAQARVTVDTKVSTIAIGRNNQAVADVVITETDPGALPDGGIVRLMLADQYGITVGSDINELRFVSAKVEVTDGDLELKSGAGSVGFGNLSFEVKNESTEASTITVSDVRINVATTLPASEKDAYKLAVGGIVAENYVFNGNADNRKEGFFTDEASKNYIMVDYLRAGATVGSEGFDPTAPFEITTNPEKGEMYYVIDGEKFGISADKYPKNVNGVVLLSVRLVAEAFGREVGWDPIKGVATITLTTYPAETVQFTVGSPYYVKNGVEQLMLYDDNTTLATADIYETEGSGRLFVPMRWLGRAMGVANTEISYDADSGIAYFNRQ